METFLQPAVKRLGLWAILLILVIACSSRSPASPAAPPLPLTPTETLDDLSPEANNTLRSLEKVDDYPLYVMYYSGEYLRARTGWTWPPEPAAACSLFAAFGQPGDMLYGRNFDWDFSPALLLFTDPPNGFASVSMVNLTFLGISPAAVKSLTDLPVGERTALLSAPSMPFDGMNEYGLAVAMAAVPDAYQDAASYDPLKPSIGSIGIIREILDHARNRRELVQHAVDMDRSNRRALQRREKNTAQGVAERHAEAALQRLGDSCRHAARVVAGRDFELVRLDQFLPVLLDAHWDAFP